MLILGKLRWFALATFFAISPIFAFAPQTSAYTYDVKNIDQVVRGYLYASMLLDCATNEGVDNVSSGDARNFSIFSEGKKPSGVYLKYNTNDASVSEGEVSCSDGAYTKAALNFFGWSDAYTFMCDLGATRVDPKVSCLDTANDSGYNNTSIFGQLKNKLKARSNGVDIFNLPNPARYILYRESYILGCHATKDRDYTDSATDKHDATQDNWGLIRYINADGSVNKPVLYKAERGLAQQTSVSANGGVDSDGYDGRANCSALITLTNKYATDYLRFVTNEQDTSQSYPGTGVAARNNEDGSKVATGDSPGTTSKPTCGVNGIGWIICPVMNFLGDVMDKISDFLAQKFLSTDTKLIEPKKGNGAYDAWVVFRDYANVAFILTFLIIIFSQVSSVGVSNYGLKKMLPKLIVAAILVNMSFYVCLIAVDLSNILGYGVRGLFDGIAKQAIDLPANQTAPGWSNTLAGILIGAVGIALALATGIIIPALFAALMVVIILVAREALIILLIIISPLAFVAYLLPNTEKWFQKWMSTFSKLLLVFPIVAAVFGASKLTSNLLMNVAVKSDDNTMKIVALGVAAVPFFVVPALLKASLVAAGAIGARMQGWGDKATKRVGAKSKEGYLGRQMAERKKIAATRNAQIAGGTYNGRGGKLNPRNLRSKAYGALNKNKLTGEAGNRLGAMGESLAQKEHLEAVGAADAAFVSGGLTDDRILEIAQDDSRSAAEREAAAIHIMKKGSNNDKKKLIESAHTITDPGTRSRIADAYATSDMAKVYGTGVAGTIKAGDSVDMIKALQKNSGEISPDVVASSPRFAEDLAKAHQTGDATTKENLEKVVGQFYKNGKVAPAPATESSLNSVLARPATATATTASAQVAATTPAPKPPVSPPATSTDPSQSQPSTTHQGQTFDQTASGLYVPRK